MTMLEKVKEAVNNHSFDGENGGDLNALVAFAYYLGRHAAAQEVCDTAREIFSAQIKRAVNNRYKHVCMAVQGGITQIYSADYSFDYDCFANDEVKLNLENSPQNTNNG